MTKLSLFFRVTVPAYDVVYQTSLFSELIHKRSFQAELLYRYVPMTFFLSWLYSLVPYFGVFIMPMLILFGAWHLSSNTNIKGRQLSALIFLVLAQWGFMGLWSFVGHTVLADTVAQSIGWASGSPFQIELAFYHLGFALATFYLLWNRDRKVLAALIVAKSTFLFGAMGVHLYHFAINGNTSAGNIGVGILYADLIFPIIAICSLMRLSNNR